MSKQSIILENFRVLESVGKITDTVIVSFNQYDISDEDKYLPTTEKNLEKLNYVCRHSWFSEFDLLCYSKSTDALFCAAYVLFPKPVHQGSRANSLITQPYRNWKDIKEDIENHSKSAISERFYENIR